MSNFFLFLSKPSACSFVTFRKEQHSIDIDEMCQSQIDKPVELSAHADHIEFVWTTEGQMMPQRWGLETVCQRGPDVCVIFYESVGTSQGWIEKSASVEKKTRRQGFKQRFAFSGSKHPRWWFKFSLVLNFNTSLTILCYVLDRPQ